MSEDNEYFYGESVEEPDELTLLNAGWAVLCGFVLGALLYPVSAKAGPAYRSSNGYPTLVSAQRDVRSPSEVRHVE